jgi:hypothetical protein
MKTHLGKVHAAIVLLLLAAGIACNGLGNGASSDGSSNMVFAGCYAPNATTNNVDCGLANSLGDANSDSTFRDEVANQSYFWSGIPATVFPWNDCKGANALSLPSGDILYGVGLFQQLVQAYGGDGAPISGVLAHEWGHQIQFTYGWFTSNEPTSRPIELEADAFSGFYMALGESYSWGSIDNYFSAVTSFGDYNFNNPSHHGTPEERLAAAQLGFQTAYDAIMTGTPLSYDDLHTVFSTAIAGFQLRNIPLKMSRDNAASQVLARLDRSQIYAILDRKNRGRNMIVPPTIDVEKLFPRK